jgi:hypothetical protein
VPLIVPVSALGYRFQKNTLRDNEKCQPEMQIFNGSDSVISQSLE